MEESTFVVTFLASILVFNIVQLAPLAASTVSEMNTPNSWPIFQHDLARTGYSNCSGPKTNHVLWHSELGLVDSAPAVLNGVVYVNSYTGTLYALNASAGSSLWSYKTGGNGISSPAVIDNVVYIGCGNYTIRTAGAVYALNAFNGDLLWNFSTYGLVNSSPAVADGLVYVCSQDCNVYALNASDGSQVWSYYMGNSSTSSPALVDKVVYVCSTEILYALNATDGLELWNYTPENERPPDVAEAGIVTSPVVVDNVVYLSCDGVYAVNATDGSLLWHKEGNKITDNSMSTPAVVNGSLYVGASPGNVWCLNASDGQLLWNFDAQSAVGASPAFADGVIYVYAANRVFYALDASTGDELWRYTTPGAPGTTFSSAAIVDGVAYVGAVNGVYAFGPSPTPTPTSTPTATPPETQDPTASPTSPLNVAPEFPSLVILALFLGMALLAALVISVKKRKITPATDSSKKYS